MDLKRLDGILERAVAAGVISAEQRQTLGGDLPKRLPPLMHPSMKLESGEVPLWQACEELGQALDRRGDPVRAARRLLQLMGEAHDLDKQAEDCVDMVRSMTFRFVPNPDDEDHAEAFSAGLKALMQVRRKFDPALGVPFWGYARRRVAGAMLDVLRQKVRRQWRNKSGLDIDLVAEESPQEAYGDAGPVAREFAHKFPHMTPDGRVDPWLKAIIRQKVLRRIVLALPAPVGRARPPLDFPFEWEAAISRRRARRLAAGPG